MLDRMNEVIVPTIVILEVFKKLLQITSESEAIIFIAQMKKGILIPLDFDLSLSAAVYGREFKLPLADSIIYATAMKHNATLYTMDKHFKSLPNVQFYEK
jgi:predicted nucleic acid-binding protein